jgi:hypothetical protein
MDWEAEGGCREAVAEVEVEVEFAGYESCGALSAEGLVARH